MSNANISCMLIHENDYFKKLTQQIFARTNTVNRMSLDTGRGFRCFRQTNLHAKIQKSVNESMQTAFLPIFLGFFSLLRDIHLIVNGIVIAFFRITINHATDNRKFRRHKLDEHLRHEGVAEETEPVVEDVLVETIEEGAETEEIPSSEILEEEAVIEDGSSLEQAEVAQEEDSVEPGEVLEDTPEETQETSEEVTEEPTEEIPSEEPTAEPATETSTGWLRSFFSRMMVAGRVDASAMITDVISLEETPDAFEALRTPSTQCKVLIDLTR